MVSPASILLPLYIYPALNAWDILYSNITANPSLNFSIIINPNSGPGATTYPNSDYIAGISQLNSYANTQLYGYVHTSVATRSQSSVKADIKKYASWQDYISADIHMDGIFFDEAPSAYTTATNNYMTSVTNYARSTLYADQVRIIFNPGVVGDSRFYSMADTIVAFENYYSAYSSGTIGTIPQAYRAQSAMLLHNFTGSVTDQANIVRSAALAGIKSLFISNQADYDAWSTLWGDFCSEMAHPN